MTVIRILLFLACCIAAHVHANTRFINAIPDLTQTEVKGAAFGNGNQFCGPVAVSNSIAWLANKQSSQLDIATLLASKEYMNTSLKNGTGTKGMLRGISRISSELFGRYKTLEYQGWRIHQRKFSTGVKTPELSWLTKNISSKSAVFLNVGWYRKPSGQSDYYRVGGHWVTLVGYQGKNKLILHDPSPRAGNSFSNEYVTVRKLKGGSLTGKKKGLPVSAKGYLSLENGMHIKSSADFAIIDGAIVLEI